MTARRSAAAMVVAALALMSAGTAVAVPSDRGVLPAEHTPSPPEQQTKLSAHEQKIAEIEAEGGYQEPDPPADDPEVVRGRAVMLCNSAVVKVVHSLPAQLRAGGWCTDYDRSLATIYVVGNATTAKSREAEIIAAGRALGVTMTVRPAEHSTAELEAVVNDVAGWPKEARRRLAPTVNGAGVDTATNSVLLVADPSATWTAEQATELLGVRVTVEIGTPADAFPLPADR